MKANKNNSLGGGQSPSRWRGGSSLWTRILDNTRLRCDVVAMLNEILLKSICREK